MIISFLIGLLVGLVVLGWWLWPVEWKDAAPVDLHQDYRQVYLEAVADLYEADPGADLNRLLGDASWNREKLERDLKQAYNNAPDTATKTRLLRLGQALNIQVNSGVQGPDAQAEDGQVLLRLCSSSLS